MGCTVAEIMVVGLAFAFICLIVVDTSHDGSLVMRSRSRLALFWLFAGWLQKRLNVNITQMTKAKHDSCLDSRF